MSIKKGASSMLKKNLLFKSFIAFSAVSMILAGTGKSIGTAGASELLVPTGARGIAINGSYSATVSGADAIFYNPAGISNMSAPTEAQFSSTNYLADIGMNYAAFAFGLGGGTFGLSFKNFDFGDIKVTTPNDTHGEAGRTFSPSFVTLTLGYSKSFSDRIRFGVNSKIINESIQETSARGFAIDMGVQYTHSSLPVNIGVVLRNLGPKMKFTGSNLEQSHQPEGSEPGTLDEHFSVISQGFEQHAQLDIALTYKPVDNLNVYGSFVNNSFGFNEFHFGSDFGIDMNGITAWVGGGFSVLSIDDTTDDWDSELTDNTFGASFGGGFKIPLGNLTFGIDYAFKTVNAVGLENNSVLAFNIGF